MITDSFDRSEPIVGPEAFYGPQKHLCELCLLTFSSEIYRHILDRFPWQPLAKIGGVNGGKPLRMLEYKGMKLAFALAGVGAPVAGTDVEEINWLCGAEKFILFGSAGSLNGEKTAGKYVVPTEAYRDEGFSYHYAPAADYIRIRNAEQVAACMEELHLPYVRGRVWTTDAFYRETRRNLEARQADGCIAVDMELAGVQAVCDFHGFELYDFLVTGDVLDAPEYDRCGLDAANHQTDKLYTALELALRVR